MNLYRCSSTNRPHSKTQKNAKTHTSGGAIKVPIIACFCEFLSAGTPAWRQHLLRHSNLDVLQSPVNDVLIFLFCVWKRSLKVGIGDGGICSSLPVCYVLSTSIKSCPWLGVCRCGLAFAAGGYVSRPSSWVEFHQHEWTHGGFSSYENSFVKFFPPRWRADVGCCLPPSSYIHVTCQYVIKDKVLQTDFSFTTMCPWFFCVCVYRGEDLQWIRSA